MKTSMNNSDTAVLRKEVRHLMVDLDLYSSHIGALAAVLEHKNGRKISRNTLSMALSGYRSTAPYAQYLSALKGHLEGCLQDETNPVTIYTKPQSSQYPKKGE
jgi:hypothetical protein